jgi:hypothetical protein
MLFVIHGGSAGVGILWGGIIICRTSSRANIVIFRKELGNGGHLAYAGTRCRQARIIRGKVHSSIGGFWW